MFEKMAEYREDAASRLAVDCIVAGIERARPTNVIDRKVTVSNGTLRIDGTPYELDEYENIYVVGGGNAAGHVAMELEKLLGNAVTDGAVVTDDLRDSKIIDVLEGAHPVPSLTGVRNTSRIRNLVDEAGPDDLVLTIVAGGGSALMTAPHDGISLDDLQKTTEALLRSGASINEINAVRKHLSAIKGGRLATAVAPATTVGLVFSDVVGDDLATIASGPISPDDTTFASALDVLNNYDIEAPKSVRKLLEDGINGEIDETPDSSRPVFERVSTHILATCYDAVAGAAALAEECGVDAMILSSRIRGEASEAALTHVATAEEIIATGNPVEPPIVIVSGGETTVTVNGDGRGGPNQEFALSAALQIPQDVVLAAVDTDGIDGATDAAGALIDSQTVQNEQAAQSALATNDAYGYLDGQDALLVSGPTGTNVNDLRVLVVGKRQSLTTST